MLQNHDAPQKAPIQPTPLVSRASGASGFAVAPMLDWLHWFLFFFYFNGLRCILFF
jgi:hypothetical protein